MKKIIYIVVAIIILIGAIMAFTKGFNLELNYTSRQEMVIVSEKNINVNEIEEIVKEILTDRKVKVQEIDRYGKAVEINASTISEDEKNSIISKVNEKYEIEVSADEVKITNVPNTRIRDILKPYILPAIIAFTISLLYFVIVYHTIGLKEVLLKGFCTPIIVELAYYSIILITRVPFGRVVNSVAVGIYTLVIIILTEIFQKEKIQKNIEKENEK